MRIILLFSFLLNFSCQTKSDMEKNVVRDPETEPQTPIVKIDAVGLEVELKAEDYEKGNLAGILLKPKLDSNGSYIAYQICTEDDSKCTEGQIDGLSPDLIYDAPNGRIKISYQACVVESKAIGDPCGKKKSLFFNHTVKNSAPLYLAHAGRKHSSKNLRREGFKVQNFLKDYESNEKDNSYESNVIDVLITNILSMDPVVLSRILGSFAFRKHLQKVRIYVGKINSNSSRTNLNSGIGILSLGSSVVVSKVFKDWQKGKDLKNTNSYVNAIEGSFSKFHNLVLEKENLKSVISVVLKSETLSRETHSLQKNLLENLADLETEIDRSKFE